MEQIVSSFQASMYSFKYANTKLSLMIFLSFLFNLRWFFFFFERKKKKKKKANTYSIKYSSSAIQLYEIQSWNLDRSPKLNLIRFNVMRTIFMLQLNLIKYRFRSFFFFLLFSPPPPFPPFFHLPFHFPPKQVWLDTRGHGNENVGRALENLHLGHSIPKIERKR